jgi:hypothetical protein
MADVSRSNITIDELLAELAKAQPPRAGDDPGWTTEELAERSGRTLYAIKQMLRDKQRQGVLRVGRKSSIGINGQPYRVNCYWIEQPAPVAKAKKR